MIAGKHRGKLSYFCPKLSVFWRIGKKKKGNFIYDMAEMGPNETFFLNKKRRKLTFLNRKMIAGSPEKLVRCP